MGVPAFGKAHAEEMLLPVRREYLILSFFVAFMLNMLPLTGWALMLRPDFVALVLLYWGMEHPRKVGFTPAFLLGLAIDVADITAQAGYAIRLARTDASRSWRLALCAAHCACCKTGSR